MGSYGFWSFVVGDEGGSVGRQRTGSGPGVIGRLGWGTRSVALGLAVLRGLALGFLLLGPVVLPASAGAQPALTTRDYRAPSVSAKDGSPLALALTEKHRADRDPNALAASGRVVLVTHGSSYSGQAGVDVQVPGVPAEQSYSMLDQLALRGYDVWTLAYQNYGRSDRHD